MLALDRTTELPAAVQEHHQLLEAIARGAGDRAAEIMGAHVGHFEEAMRGVLLTHES